MMDIRDLNENLLPLEQPRASGSLCLQLRLAGSATRVARARYEYEAPLHSRLFYVPKAGGSDEY
eukprot:scaffold230923_cov14-Prasinocladus_malaysianus.AAC.1